MNIFSPKKDELSKDLLRSIFIDYRFVPYREYGIRNEYLLDYVVDDVFKSLSRDTHVLLAKEDEKNLGLVVSERLEWDSKHFGKEIARINYTVTRGEPREALKTKNELLSSLISVLSERGIDLAMARVHAEDISGVHILESHGFKLMDTLVTYSFEFDKTRPFLKDFKETCSIRPWKEDDVSDLMKIAYESFSKGRVATSHFHADPLLNREKSDALYVNWVKEACQGKADMVLVAESNGSPVGFHICNIHHDLVRILKKKIGALPLSAVSPRARVRGIYTSMLHAGLVWHSDKVDVVEGGTVVYNYPVRRALTKLGFKPMRSQHTFHKWLTKR